MLPWTTWISGVAMVTHPATPQALSLKCKRPPSYYHHRQALQFNFYPLVATAFLLLLGICFIQKITYIIYLRLYPTTDKFPLPI